MNEAVWLGDKDERTVYANKKFANILGYTLEEMLGRESYDFWDNESAKRVKNVNNTDRKKGVSSSYEGNLLTKDGKKIPVLLSGSPFPGGGTVGIMTDLTALKKKEEQEMILNKSIEYSTDAIITFDKSLKVQTWNKGAKLIFGYSKKNILNSKITKIFSTKDITKSLSHEKTSHNFKINGEHKNKRKLIIDATLTHISTGDEKDKKIYLLIARDITKQTKFKKEFAQKYKEMKKAYNKFEAIKKQLDSVMRQK
jgi:PAS domain S-box-containing protein